jgi:hypothetical protein
MPGWTAGLGVGPRQLGFAQVSVSLFFYFISFILFPVFCVAISSTSLPFYFAGFELAIHLQYLEFEIP